jgi:molecular chaperone GrpE
VVVQGSGDRAPAEDIEDLIAKDDESPFGGDPVVEGIRLIRARLIEILRKYGVVEMEDVGAKFDPHLHDAVLQVPAGDVPDGHIAQVLERGYWLGERVLRPAKVAVASEGRG